VKTREATTEEVLKFYDARIASNPVRITPVVHAAAPEDIEKVFPELREELRQLQHRAKDTDRRARDAEERLVEVRGKLRAKKALRDSYAASEIPRLKLIAKKTDLTALEATVCDGERHAEAMRNLAAASKKALEAFPRERYERMKKTLNAANPKNPYGDPDTFLGRGTPL
jgi:hypothetical protein